ncbi:MAG: serine/threonine-protein kinase [Pirellula sp.]
MALEQISELFDAAIAFENTDARMAFLREHCAADQALLKEVTELVESHFRGNELLESPTQVLKLIHQSAGATQEDEGAIVGNYKLLQRIGEGGMGVVFMAEQLRPIRRKVACKIIREGMHSKQILARFEAEREALARLDHPNVTRILDSGTTNSGRPYFVMELVRGTTITEYCNSHRVPINERLVLLEHVCQVIHHAHQKGIVHRDVKPSNVMITLHDGVPVPKVIDFGIAKALDRPLTEQTLFTRYGDLIGTPEYMSPEQAEMSGLDLDVRTDIYSLGVLMYELLTGSTPLTSAQIQGKGLLKIFETIRDHETEVPSSRLTRTLVDTPVLADQRQTNAMQLKRTIAGELDWITMKAIAKDRNERYESAAALAKDLRRYLNDEPIEAAAPSIGYKVRKFFNKHRTACVVALGCTAMLLTSTAFSVYWAISSYANQQIAMQRSQELELNGRALEEAKERAESALDRALIAEKKAERMARLEQNKAVLSRANAIHFREIAVQQFGKLIRIGDSSNVLMAPVSHSGSQSIEIAEEKGALGTPPATIISASSAVFTGRTSTHELPEELKEMMTFLIPKSSMESTTESNTRVVRISAEMILPERLQEIIIEEQRKEFGSQDPFVAESLTRLADTLLRAGSGESLIRSENHLREAISIWEQHSGTELDILEAKILFARVLSNQGKALQAVSVMSEARERIRKLESETLDASQKTRLKEIAKQASEKSASEPNNLNLRSNAMNE